jgi:membrane-associated phospholipid phosphatase
MTGIESWGTSVILWLQSFSVPPMDLFFRLVTFLGDEKFYLFLLPLVYWCVDKRLGIRLALVVMASNTVNLWCKFALGLPRPSSPPVHHIVDETGPGFPSGHTQSVTVAFGYVASQVQRWRVHIVAAVLVFLVGLSRMYLGVHFPHDVLGGLVLGYAVLFIFVKATPLLERAWASWPRGLRYGLALGGPLVLFAVWPLEDTAGSLGALGGFAVGGLIEQEQVRFVPSGTALRRLLRFLLGRVFVAGLYFGLKAALPAGLAWRFLRYGTVGLVATGVAPWLFVRLGLAQAEPVAAEAA